MFDYHRLSPQISSLFSRPCQKTFARDAQQTAPTCGIDFMCGRSLRRPFPSTEKGLPSRGLGEQRSKAPEAPVSGQGQRYGPKRIACPRARRLWRPRPELPSARWRPSREASSPGSILDRSPLPAIREGCRRTVAATPSGPGISGRGRVACRRARTTRPRYLVVTRTIREGGPCSNLPPDRVSLSKKYGLLACGQIETLLDIAKRPWPVVLEVAGSSSAAATTESKT
jgi:hypothetical protein